jgi:presenilin-like A22 family membrane protease
LYPWIEIPFAIVGCIIGSLTFICLTLNKCNLYVKNAIIAILGIAVGTIFGLVLPLPTFLTLLIVISIFDIYSVFKGPISKIFQKSNLSVSQQANEFIERSIAIGIGDFIFYSSLVTFVTKELGLAIGISAILGILVGIKVTERLLLRYGKFPGLPIPILFALILSGLAWIVNHYFLAVFRI